MATYGAKYIRFAPMATEPADALPTYAGAIGLAELQKVSDNPNYIEAKQPGDDRTVEYMREFVDADIDVETTDLDNDIQHAVFGARLSGDKEGEKDLIFGVDDSAPYGGLGFVVCRIRKNVKSYQGVLYTKVKAAMQGEEYSTKGDSITLTGGKLKFKGLAPECGDWKIKSPHYATAAEAIAWIDTKLPKAAG